MANSRIYFKSEAGGTTTLSRDTTANSGNLVLPASGNVSSVDTAVTDNAIARYDSTTGKLQNSGVIIDDNNNVGIGTNNPLGKLTISNGSEENVEFFTGSAALNGGGFQYIHRGGASTRPDLNYYLSGGGGSHKFFTNDIERMRIDSSGNVGIGVTPKPWYGSYTRAIELGLSSDGGTIWSSLNQNVSHIGIGANFYMDSSFTPKYKASYTASQYNQQNGAHYWQTAPSGTAGNAITWTNAMTLDASGYLYFGGDIADATTTGIRRGSAGQLILRASSGGLYHQANTNYYLVTTAGGSTSDSTLKKDIEVIPNSLNKILNLKGVYYEFIEEQLCTADKGKQIGVIAQDVEQEFPEIVLTNEDGIKTVRYDRLIAPMIEAIKEQQEIINDLKSRIEILEGAK